MEIATLLAEKISPDIVEKVLNDIFDLIGANLTIWINDYTYQPRDPPRKRREVMSRTIDVNLETLLRFITFIMMRGGNPKRAMKNLDERVRAQITAIMDQMKVKGFTQRGMYSTWQWMTSYWDHTVILCVAKPQLLEHYFVVGPWKFQPVLPGYCYVIGALHLFRGVDEKLQGLIKNEMFRHQHFLISTKNSLDPKKVKNNQDSPDFMSARVTQANYMDFQMKDDVNNFTDQQISYVRVLAKLDLNTVNINLFKSTHDYLNDPYSANEADYRAK
jgi:hypothetical protein